MTKTISDQVKEVVEIYDQGSTFTARAVHELLPTLSEAQVRGGIQSAKNAGLCINVDGVGNRGVYQRTLIQPKPVHPKTDAPEEERIQAALLVLIPGNKFKITNLGAINRWVEATKALLKEVK